MKPSDWSFVQELSTKEIFALRYVIKVELVKRRRHEANPLISIPNQYRTHCPKNHPYFGDNLFINANGQRQCKACSRERSRLYRLRNPEKSLASRRKHGSKEEIRQKRREYQRAYYHRKKAERNANHCL